MTRIHAMTDDALGQDDGVAVAARIASGEISATEAVEAAIARLQTVDGSLHALVCDRFDAARREAAAPRPGPLSGVPTFIKDNTDLPGLPTRHGSRAVPATPRQRTGEFAEQLLSTGMIALGKSSLPEFGLTCSTEFTQGPATTNPWDTSHSAGGSSGGSASLVAAGVVPLAHANDGGGSIRIPAACCGLVGLKSSRGRMREDKMTKGMPLQLVSDGVVSRSVRDTAAFFAAAEQHYANPGLPRVGHVTAPNSKRLRVGIVTELPDGSQAQPDCLAAVDAVGKACEALGHQVTPLAVPFRQQMADDFFLYWAALAASLTHLGQFVVLKGFQRSELEPLTEHLARHFRRNAWRFPGALRRLRAYGADYAALFKDVDVLLSPTLAHAPAELGYLALDLPFDTAWARLSQYATFTPTQNVTGAPAISLPLWRTAEQLPVGIQIASGIGEEARLLSLALELEEAMPWPQVWDVQAAMP